MKNIRLYIYAALVLLILLPTLNATVDSVFVFHDSNENEIWDTSTESYDYDYAIIGRTYFLSVGYTSDVNPLPIIDSLELTNPTPELGSVLYTFKTNTTAATRVFGTENNQFQISVISEADELADVIKSGSVIITINDDSSSVQINDLDLGNRVINLIDLNKLGVDIPGVTGSLDLKNILNGFNFNLSFVKGQKYPIYNSLLIDGNSLAGAISLGVLIDNNISCGIVVCTVG